MRRGERRWAQTLVQKILRRHVLDGGSADVGEFVSLRPRHVLTHDNSFAVIKKFREVGAARVYDPSQLVFALDHDIQNTSAANLDRYRAIGEFAEAQGIDVYRMRIGAVMAGSALMAIGGAFLTMSAFNAFFFEMVAGRGWICIALVVFASWRPSKALLGALLFGAFDALQVRLQQVIGGVPYQVYLMLPYVLSILALIVMSRRAGYPRALMVPYRKGER